MNPQSISIIDYGGLFGAHITQGTLYAKAGAFLKIKYCASACLLMLAQVPQDHVCVYRDAWFGYHTAAQDANGYESPTTIRWERGRDWIARGYTPC